MSSTTLPPEAQPWHARAGDLAGWAIERYRVRRDAYGAYRLDSGEVKGVTVKAELTRDVLREKHFRADRPGRVLGAHSLACGKESFGKLAALDLDCKPDAGGELNADPAANRA